MPTYEYLCRACATRFEIVQSFSDDALTVCDECGGELRKVFSAAGLIFKGSGWHIKDYSGSSGPSGPSGPSGSSGSSSDGAKSDSTKPSGEAKPSGDGGSKATPTATPAASSSTGNSGNSGSSKASSD